MITPEYLNKIIKDVESQVSWLNMYLIKRMARRIVTAFTTMQDNLLIPSTISDYHKLISAGMVHQDIEQALIKEMPRLKKEIKKAFIDSADEIAKYNRHEEKKLIEIAGMNPSELPSDKAFAKVAKEHNMTEEEVKALEQAYQRTNGTLKNYTKTTAMQSEKEYIRVCDEAFMKVKSGVSLNTACIEAIDDLAKQGILTVSYGNRVDTIETAVTRAVRTGINQANSEIVLRRCSELGTAFVKVSSHLGARVTKNNDFTNHSWWQGKIYHLDWNDPKLSQYKAKNHKNDDTVNKYPDFVKCTGYGHILGLCGINCRHTFSAFYPDLQEDTEDTYNQAENEKRFKAEQGARAMERKIREYKRRIEALKEYDDDESVAKRKLLTANLSSYTDKYMQYCKDNKIKPNNMRMQIGKTANMPVIQPIQSNMKARSVFNANNPLNENADYRIKNSDLSEECIDSIAKHSKEIVKNGHDNNKEYAYALDLNGNELAYEEGEIGECMTTAFFNEIESKLTDLNKESVILLHNHTDDGIASITDLNTLNTTKYVMYSIMACNNGDMHMYKSLDKSVYIIDKWIDFDRKELDKLLKARPDYDKIKNNTGMLTKAEEREIAKVLIALYFEGE